MSTMPWDDRGLLVLTTPMVMTTGAQVWTVPMLMMSRDFTERKAWWRWLAMVAPVHLTGTRYFGSGLGNGRSP